MDIPVTQLTHLDLFQESEGVHNVFLKVSMAMTRARARDSLAGREGMEGLAQGVVTHSETGEER